MPEQVQPRQACEWGFVAEGEWGEEAVLSALLVAVAVAVEVAASEAATAHGNMLAELVWELASEVPMRTEKTNPKAAMV